MTFLARQVGLEADVPLFACDNTLDALAGTGVRCAPMAAPLWGAYLAALQRCDFLLDAGDERAAEILSQLVREGASVKAFYERRKGVEDVMMEIGASETS